MTALVFLWCNTSDTIAKVKRKLGYHVRAAEIESMKFGPVDLMDEDTLGAAGDVQMPERCSC